MHNIYFIKNIEKILYFYNILFYFFIKWKFIKFILIILTIFININKLVINLTFS